MGTNYDENAAAPVVVKKTTVNNDRNSGKRKQITHFPPVGVSFSANKAANWLGARNKESSYFLCSK